MMDLPKIIKILMYENKKHQKPIITTLGEKTNDPYKVLTSCILSLRTKDKITGEASQRLFKLASTPHEMMVISTKQIEKAIYPVGFYKTKAKRIKDISKTLIEKFNSKVPDNFETLMTLKGVGRKTAGITMCYGHKKPVSIPTDIHVHVVANRIGWVKTKTPEQTDIALMSLIPKKYWYDLNDLLVSHGQNICLTRKPLCYKCPIIKYCKYPNKNLKEFL